MGTGNTPSDSQICETIEKMGADQVILNRLNGTLYIAFYRHGGCGRLYRNVCNYLARRFPDQRIVVLESPRVGKVCHKARVRPPRCQHFMKASVVASAACLGV